MLKPSPRPLDPSLNEGGCAGDPLKQRAEAYQLAREAPGVMRQAIADIAGEKPKVALASLDNLANAIEANPQAQRILKQRDPELLAGLEHLRAEAKRLAPNEVRLSRQSEWHQPAPGWQTRLNLGRSDMGHHFRLEVSFQGQDRSQPWSRAYRSERIAELAGQRTQRAETRWITREGPPLQRGHGLSR